jgi:hypothetical protein
MFGEMDKARRGVAAWRSMIAHGRQNQDGIPRTWWNSSEDA